MLATFYCDAIKMPTFIKENTDAYTNIKKRRVVALIFFLRGGFNFSHSYCVDWVVSREEAREMESSERVEERSEWRECDGHC